MEILLCAATEMEIQPTISFLEGLPFTTTRLLITGVGMPETIYRLTKKVASYRPGLILQAGVAGSLDPDLKPGTLVSVNKECMGDLGVEENGMFRSIWNMGLAERSDGIWENGYLPGYTRWVEESGLPSVTAVTINEISTDPERISYYRNSLQASIESMEGAACHLVSLKENIPFLQIRSISNFVGERDKTKWLMKESIIRLNEHLQQLILKITTI